MRDLACRIQMRNGGIEIDAFSNTPANGWIYEFEVYGETSTALDRLESCRFTLKLLVGFRHSLTSTGVTNAVAT